MIARITGAVARGILVALLLATPALMLPRIADHNSQVVLVLGMLAAFLTFSEYFAKSPSIVEFRDAPPFNRLRFLALFACVLVLSLICKGLTDPTATTNAVTSIGTIVGNAIDFPYSPVRLVVLLLPPDADPSVVSLVRTAAGITYFVSLIAMTAFLILVRAMNWPIRHGPFNVWVNLPLFDPTAGGDVLKRLRRDARINIALGFLLPFIIPAIVKLMTNMIGSIELDNPQTLIWTMSAWAFLPTSIIMRGIAMSKIADLIQEKRRQTYAKSPQNSFYRAA